MSIVTWTHHESSFKQRKFVDGKHERRYMSVLEWCIFALPSPVPEYMYTDPTTRSPSFIFGTLQSVEVTSETLSHKVAENWAAQPSGPGCLLSQWARLHAFTVGPVACLIISGPGCTPSQWARLHALSVDPVSHLHSGPGRMPYQWARLHTFTVGPTACRGWS